MLSTTLSISVGRNNLNLEGHLQIGYNSKTIKNYNKPVETQPVQTQLVETQPVQPQEELKCSGGFGGVDRLYKDVKKEGKFNINRTKIKEWLMKQDAYTLHKPICCRFKRHRMIVGGIDQQWQMDLANMQSMQKINDGYRYLLVCIDVFFKYAWVVPLKNKKGPSLVAYKIILANGSKPKKIITDQGAEFFNKHFKVLLKDEDIELYNMYNETKASVVEL